ncbi:MAG: radical SAM protein [Polyangiaceae bacterium]
MVIRGGTDDFEAVKGACDRAKEAGVVEVVLRSALYPYGNEASASRLATAGVSTVLAPLFSAHPKAHDAVAGVRDSLTRTLVGMRACAATGMRVEVEVPLLPSRLQNLEAVVELAHRAVPGVAAAHFFVPASPQAESLSPGTWAELKPRLIAAMHRCQELGVAPTLPPRGGVPYCALTDAPALLGTFRFNPRTRAIGQAGFSRSGPCESCSADFCPGVRAWQLEAESDAGLTPVRRIAASVRKQTNTRQREWSEREKLAARRTDWFYVRPTVNCSQDCVFCSANETAKNHWEDPNRTFRAISRAARRGVRRINFTGGEPTLSPHLLDFIRVAKRCGIPEIDISTNAISLTSAKRVEQLVSAGLTDAFVSLHAHDEALSQSITLKRGDFERTRRGAKALLEHGVRVTLNHVINTRNLRYLNDYVEMVRDYFDARALLSFAMITPQYRALENIALIPSLSEASPYLMRAAALCLDLGQPFYIGAQQGTPPCFLGPFKAWSDAIFITDDVLAGNADAKVKGPGCETCRFTAQCTGVWRTYADRFGVDELRPVEGPPFTSVPSGPPRDLISYFPRGFSDVPEELRDRDAEARLEELCRLPTTRATRHLPVVADAPSRPSRVLLFGSSGQARRLAGAMREVRGMLLDAVASPHMTDSLAATFDASGWGDPDAALEMVRPDLVVIASATRSHRQLAEAATKSGYPVLVEKPVGATVADVEELEKLSASTGVLVMPAHNVLFAPGLLDFLQRPAAHRALISRQLPANHPSAPATWDRQALAELMYHAILLAEPNIPEEIHVGDVAFVGASRPAKLQATLHSGDIVVDLRFDYTCTGDLLEIVLDPGPKARRWRRHEQDVTTGELVGDGWVTRPVERSAGEHAAMLQHFYDCAREVVRPRVHLAQARRVKGAVGALMDAFQAAGAPFVRAQAPKHTASPGLPSRIY